MSRPKKTSEQQQADPELTAMMAIRQCDIFARARILTWMAARQKIDEALLQREVARITANRQPQAIQDGSGEASVAGEQESGREDEMLTSEPEEAVQ